MTKEIILLKTVKSFCEVAIGEFELQLKFDESIPERVSHPLYESAKDIIHDALRKGIAQLFQKHNFTLPPNMTHSTLIEKLIDTRVVDQCIPEPLYKIYDLLEDLVLNGVSSSCFHTVLMLVS